MSINSSQYKHNLEGLVRAVNAMGAHALIVTAKGQFLTCTPGPNGLGGDTYDIPGFAQAMDAAVAKELEA